jgi:tRNA A-37 threonylcarbamoyl transferase component Bud32/tetratricopeptide (TPR) repeat protein
MADLLEPLRTALADRYLIERELGRGGMAIVYLAEDRRHQRRVALKVLRPELAASIGAERFLREITTAAQLTHPNILPLFDSGEADGTLYYTMPYVEGESLRDRLNHEKQLPIDDALQITREVADALGYAHEQGIVHRDIKPENILFQRGHALVADFGIARAVTAAGAETLTETGLAVGTPAYMSPEQGAGAADLDGRSDLYSLGCVMYEMLSGETPYTGPTPQAILAKKLTEPLPRITAVRETVPAPVEAALTKALAKAPADRYVTAEQFTAALALDAAAFARRRRHGRRGGLVAALAAVAVTVIASGAYGAWWFLTTGKPGTVFATGAMDPGDRVLLADFVNRTDDPALGYAVQELIRAELSDPKLVRLMDPTAVRDAEGRMQLPPGTPLDDRLARELAEREGAKAFVTGEVMRLGSTTQFIVRVVGTADGAQLLLERVTAHGEDDIVNAVDRLGRSLRRGIGESVRSLGSRPALPRVTTSSIDALRAYATALQCEYSGECMDRTIPLLQEAAAADTTFAMAYFKLSAFLANRGRLDEERAAADQAYRYRQRLPQLERLLVEAQYHAAHGDTEGEERAFRRVVELDPTNVVALGRLANIRLEQRRFTEAEDAASLAITAGCEAYWCYWNLLEAQAALRRFATADSLLAHWPRSLAPVQWHFRRLLAWARKDFEAVDTLLQQRVQKAASRTDSLDPMTDRAVLNLVHGRVAEGQRSWSPYWGFGRALNWATFHLAYRADTVGAQSMLAEALRRQGWDTLPPPAREYRRVIPLLARLGRSGEARRLLDDWSRSVPDDQYWITDRWEGIGWIAVAEGHLDSAVSAFKAWHDAPFAGARHLFNRGLVEAGMVYDRVGASDSAVALFERALSTPYLNGYAYEAAWYPFVLRRLGELHESLGHRDEAKRYYGEFIDLWKDADPELQPQVEEARAALARLTGEPP